MKRCIAATVLWLFNFTSAMSATITIDSNTTLGADTPHTRDNLLVVPGLTPPTIVNIVEGAELNGDQENAPVIDVFGNSIVNQYGGSVGDYGRPAFRLNQTARVNVLGGRFGDAELRDEGRMTMTAATATSIRTYGNSIARIDSGALEDLWARDHSRIIVNGGYHDYLFAEDQSQVIFRGGNIAIGVGFVDQTRVLMTGGNVVDDIHFGGDAVFSWRGGSIARGEILRVTGSAEAHIYGRNFQFIIDSDEGWPMIVGQWIDGKPMGTRYGIYDQGKIVLHEVPEPSTSIMAVAGALFVATAVRRRQIV